MTTQEFSDQFDVLLNSSFIENEFGEQSSKIDIQLDEFEKSVFLTQAQEQLVINLYNGRNIEGLSFESAEESRRYLKDLTERKTYYALKDTSSNVYLNSYYITDNIITVDSFFKTLTLSDIDVDIIDTEEKTVEITHLNTPYENILIPKTILINGDSYTIIGIGNNVFYNISTIKSIFIPDSIEYISDGAIYIPSTSDIICEVDSKPTNWESGWDGGANIIWGCTSQGYVDIVNYKNRINTINGCLFITKETSLLKDDNLPQWTANTNGKQTIVEVIPITQDEYHRFKRNPYKTFNEYRVLRIEDNNQLQLYSKFNIETYSVDYIRKPKPIIVSDLGGLSVDEETTVQTSELNPILHRTILLEAVKLAKIVKQNQIRNEMLGNMPGQLVHPPMQPVNQRPN